jgi:glycosyltransferase involved in cell wall biosynthesis
VRVTYIHQHYRRPSMSGGTRSHEFARFLAGQGHTVTLIASWQSPDPPRVPVEHVDGYEVRWIHVPYSNYLRFSRRVLAFVHFMWRASVHAARTPADVIFATSTPLTVVVPGIVGAWARRVPWVLEVRDLWPELPIAVGALRNPALKWLARYLERSGYRSAKHIVALSPGMREGVIRAGCLEEKVTVIPNLADLERFSSHGCDPGRFLRRYPALRGKRIVTYAGTVGLINGVHYLVEIAAHAVQEAEDVAFCILGDGRELDRVRCLAQANGTLGRNVFILAPLPKTDMPDALAAATMCTSLVVDLPELRANSANKFFDALAAGRPIAINHEGWQADLIRETGAGLVLPPHDSKASWLLLRQFLETPGVAESAGRRAREVAELSFDKAKLSRELERVLITATGI